MTSPHRMTTLPSPTLAETCLMRGGQGQEMRSYGLILLHKIKEAKEFAKADKAVDANIPIHLWNDRVICPGITKDKRNTTLAGFRRLRQRVYMHRLA